MLKKAQDILDPCYGPPRVHAPVVGLNGVLVLFENLSILRPSDVVLFWFPLDNGQLSES